jgi:hypothetical protein
VLVSTPLRDIMLTCGTCKTGSITKGVCGFTKSAKALTESMQDTELLPQGS